MFDFLRALDANNSLEWMHENQKAYRAARESFLRLVRALMNEIARFDEGIPPLRAEDLLFKLNRDTRFSKDKSPYTPAFRAHIAPAGKLPIPVGYYVSISPGGRSFLGGGLFAHMFKDATNMVRDYIMENGDALEAIVRAGGLTIRGEALKSVPGGYDPLHPQAAYLKHKSWYLEFPVEDLRIQDEAAFVIYAGEIYKRIKPFNDYLNAALQGFQMPERR